MKMILIELVCCLMSAWGFAKETLSKEKIEFCI